MLLDGKVALITGTASGIDGFPRYVRFSVLARCGPGMPGPYKMRLPAFVGAGHAPPALEASTLRTRRHPAANHTYR